MLPFITHKNKFNRTEEALNLFNNNKSITLFYAISVAVSSGALVPAFAPLALPFSFSSPTRS